MQKNKQMQKNKRQNVKNVRIVIRQTVTGYAGLSLGIVLAVAGAIVTALLPPWILGSIVDTITAGNAVPVALVILYFAFTVLTGLTESLREGLLTVFGQKITHALRSSMMEKYTNLTAGELTKQGPVRSYPGSWEMWTQWRICSLRESSVCLPMPAKL